MLSRACQLQRTLAGRSRLFRGLHHRVPDAWPERRTHVRDDVPSVQRAYVDIFDDFGKRRRVQPALTPSTLSERPSLNEAGCSDPDAEVTGQRKPESAQ